MKQCQMHISPAPECLVPCPEDATKTLYLDGGVRMMYLCKNHYDSINKYITTKDNKKTIIDIDGLN
jgi:hypothetical protein